MEESRLAFGQYEFQISINKNGKKQIRNPQSSWRRRCAAAWGFGSCRAGPRLALQTLPCARKSWLHALVSHHLSLGRTGHTTDHYNPGALWHGRQQSTVYNLSIRLNNKPSHCELLIIELTSEKSYSWEAIGFAALWQSLHVWLGIVFPPE